MIQLDERTPAVRKLLRQLRRPHLLTRDELAVRLRDRLGARDCRDAIVQLIDRTFSASAGGGRLREILLRTDLHGEKASMAAGSMHLSLRQFFRCRAEAVEALALAIEQLDSAQVRSGHSSSPVYCAMCFQQIVNP